MTRRVDQLGPEEKVEDVLLQDKGGSVHVLRQTIHEAWLVQGKSVQFQKVQERINTFFLFETCRTPFRKKNEAEGQIDKGNEG